MRAGRLPEDHPEEQEARDRLRALSPGALEKLRQQHEQPPVPAPGVRSPRSAPVRWRPGQ